MINTAFFTKQEEEDTFFSCFVMKTSIEMIEICTK